MNIGTRRRAFRSMLAGLLQSELSDSEIREIADDLSWGSLGREFSEYVRDSLFTMNTDRLTNYKVASDRYDPIHAELKALISERRLPKKIVQQLILSAAPKLKTMKALPKDFTMDELLEHFLRSATSNDISAFLNILRGEPADAYLKGISRRGK
jgi:hypothetical protein